MSSPPPILGATYTDKITGFKGVAVGYVQYITGCNQVLIQPKAVEGAMKDSHWIDEQRLDVEHAHPVVMIANGNTNPGSDKAPPKI